MSLFVDGDIPYIRAGSSKSFAHDDAEATAILDVFMKTRTQTLFAPRRPRRLKLFQVKSMEMKKVLRMIAHLIQIRSTGRRKYLWLKQEDLPTYQREEWVIFLILTMREIERETLLEDDRADAATVAEPEMEVEDR
eukprot:s2813_g5.t2